MHKRNNFKCSSVYSMFFQNKRESRYYVMKPNFPFPKIETPTATTMGGISDRTSLQAINYSLLTNGTSGFGQIFGSGAFSLTNFSWGQNFNTTPINFNNFFKFDDFTNKFNIFKTNETFTEKPVFTNPQDRPSAALYGFFANSGCSSSVSPATKYGMFSASQKC